MACLDMYNSDQHKSYHPPPMSPRISFSNDFVDSQHIIKPERAPSSAVSTDFEFSVSNYSMLSADELFFKGRLLPFKDNNNNLNNSNQMQRTIRDELLVGDDDDNDDNYPVSLRPPKGSSSSSSTKWKGLLGLKRTHIASKKTDKITDNTLHLPKNSQEFVSEGGSSHRDVEIGI